MEALRYSDFLSKTGSIIASNQPVKNIAYPDETKILAAIKATNKAVIVDTATITSELHNSRVGNIAVLGALTKRVGKFDEQIKTLIKKKFASKGEAVVEANLKAFEMGQNS